MDIKKVLEKAIVAMQAEVDISEVDKVDLSYAIVDCKQAIECLDGQEPYAYEYGEEVYWHTNPELNDHIRNTGTPLYLHPFERKPLSDDEIDEIGNVHSDEQGYIPIDAWYDFARAIEAKIKS